MSEKVKNRITFIDIAKGVAMLLVVMHHCGGNLDRGMSVITIIDVPLFFLCSGYLAYKPSYSYRREFIKKTKGILFPFVLAMCFISLWRRENVIDLFCNDITKSGYWFLEALYIVFILWWGTHFISLRNKMLQIPVCIIVEIGLLGASKFLPESIDNIFCFSSLARYYPCFVAGAMLREYNIRAIRNKWIGLGLIVVTILGFGHWSTSNNIDFILQVGAYITSAILLFYFIRVIEKEIPCIISSQLSIIGQYSLNIYIIHFFLVPNIADGLPDAFIIHLVYSLALAIVISYVSMVIGRFLTAMTPLDKVLR